MSETIVAVLSLLAGDYLMSWNHQVADLGEAVSVTRHQKKTGTFLMSTKIVVAFTEVSRRVFCKIPETSR